MPHLPIIIAATLRRTGSTAEHLGREGVKKVCPSVARTDFPDSPFHRPLESFARRNAEYYHASRALAAKPPSFVARCFKFLRKFLHI